MKIRTPSGVEVNTEKRLWAQNLSEEDYWFCEEQLTQQLGCDRDCRCSVCIQEDSDMIDAWERRQIARESGG